MRFCLTILSFADLMRLEATYDVQRPEQFPRAQLILGPQTKDEGIASVAGEWLRWPPIPS